MDVVLISSFATKNFLQLLGPEAENFKLEKLEILLEIIS